MTNEPFDERRATLDEYDYSPILDELDALGKTGVGTYEVFRDFVDVVLTTLDTDATPPTEIFEKYEELASTDIDAGKRFSAALEALLEAYNDVNHDVIGTVYERLEIQNESSGQYFTPQNVTELMADILTAADTDSAADSTDDDAMARLTMTDSDGDGDEPGTVHDPACGTGRTLIDAVLAADETPVVTGVDKSVIAAKMTAINCAVMNVEAHIWHGDSLTLDMHQRWDITPTPMQLGHVSRTRIPDESSN